MADYVDGFALPIPLDRLDEYRRVSETVASIWKEHGALDYREFEGDDLKLEGTRSFPEVLGVTESEVTVFGWVVFESREARDLANQRVPNDPKMTELMESSDIGFDAARMAYGGFKPLV